MSLMPMSSMYGDYDPNQPQQVIQDASQKRRMAQALMDKGAITPEAQMISGHYVAPSITQRLAGLLNTYQGGMLNREADKEGVDYQNNKNKAMADIIAGRTPQTINNGAPVTTNAPYTPEQQDQFGSPLPNVQRDQITTQPTITETPQQASQRNQNSLLSYIDTYGNGATSQYLLSQLNKQDDRAYQHDEKLDDRNYQGTIRNEDRTHAVDDRNANQTFQRETQDLNFGHEDKSQAAGFGQQWRLQASSQAAARNLEAMKANNQEADTPQLNDDALTSAAQRYRQTGIIPPLGQGKAASALRSSIINRASILDKSEGIDSKSASDNIITGAGDAAAVKRATSDFTSGKNGNTVRSLNVAVSHLGTLERLGSALDNGDLPLFNQIGNEYAKQTGKAAPTNFNAAKQIVADEVVKAVVGAGGAVSDREDAAKTINAAQSPAQLKQAISTYKELMGGQLKGLQQQYEQGTHRKDFDRFLNPETKQELSTPKQTQANHPDDINLLLKKYGGK